MKKLPSGLINNSGDTGLFAILHRFFFRVCICYSIFCFILSVADVLFLKTKINGGMLLWIALFSLLLGIVYLITDFIKTKIKNLYVVYTIHFLLMYGAFSLIVYNMFEVISKQSFNSPIISFIMLTFAFIGIYIIVAVVKIYAHSLKMKLLAKSEKYTPVYTDTEEN